MKRGLASYGAMLMALLLAACASNDEGDPSQPEGGAPTIQSLQVTPAQARTPVGFDQQFTATAFLSDGSSRDVTSGAGLNWSSSNASVSNISATGLAKGITPGTVTITASGTSNGTQFSATAQLTVTSAVVASLQVTPATASVPAGLDQPFLATAFLSDGSSLDVTHSTALSWNSSNALVATVAAGGIAKGISAGSAVITASGTANGVHFSGRAELTVTNATVKSLQVTPATASIPGGVEQPFVATAFLSDGSALDVTRSPALSWSSSNASVATITAKGGVATGLAPGTVTITATGTARGSPFSGTAQLTVTSATVTSLQVTPATASIPVGLEQTFVATAFLSDGSSLDVTHNAALNWTSSNPAIATVGNGSDGGLVTGAAVGTVTITASGTAKGAHFSATAHLTVTGAVVRSLQITPAAASIPVGLAQPFVATAFLSDGSSLDVTDDAALSWSSSDPTIATVGNGSNGGLVTGAAAGTVTIRASGTTGGAPFSATAQVTVTSAVVTSMQVTPATASIPVGLEQPFAATVFLSDGSSLDVTHDPALSWSSSNPTVATVGNDSDGGVATGAAVGTVTITATGVARGIPFTAAAQLTVTSAVVTALQVTPPAASVPAGFEQSFVAVAVLSDGSSQEITDNAALSWSSSDVAVATISATGLATGVREGTAIVTATGVVKGSQFSATAHMTVTAAVVTSLQIIPPTAPIPVGFEQQLTAIVSLSDGSTLDVTDNAALSWSSSNVAVATVSTGGLVTGITQGNATITASGTVGGAPFSATAQVTVTSAVVTSLQVTPAAASIPVGFEQPFVAIASLSDGSSVNITHYAVLSWTSSAPTIATIGRNINAGVATGTAVGNATIRATGTANGVQFSATAQLTVTSAVVTSLKVTPVAASTPVGLEKRFTATATLSDGSLRDISNDPALSWSSSNPAIASIGSGIGGGVAAGLTEGTVTITASGIANGSHFSATAALAVTVPSGCDRGTISLAGVTFTCPLTQAEAEAINLDYQAIWFEHGTYFVLMDWNHAQGFCGRLGNGYRLPTSEELRNLTFRYGPLNFYGGWPSFYWYWTSTGNLPDGHRALNVYNGFSDFRFDYFWHYVSCAWPNN